MPGEYTDGEVDEVIDKIKQAKTIEEISAIWAEFYEKHYSHLRGK